MSNRSVLTPSTSSISLDGLRDDLLYSGEKKKHPHVDKAHDDDDRNTKNNTAWKKRATLLFHETTSPVGTITTPLLNARLLAQRKKKRLCINTTEESSAPPTSTDGVIPVTEILCTPQSALYFTHLTDLCARGRHGSHPSTQHPSTIIRSPKRKKAKTSSDGVLFSSNRPTHGNDAPASFTKTRRMRGSSQLHPSFYDQGEKEDHVRVHEKEENSTKNSEKSEKNLKVLLDTCLSLWSTLECGLRSGRWSMTASCSAIAGCVCVIFTIACAVIALMLLLTFLVLCGLFFIAILSPKELLDRGQYFAIPSWISSATLRASERKRREERERVHPSVCYESMKKELQRRNRRIERPNREDSAF